MNKHIVAPLVLLSSIALLTSCMKKEEVAPVVVPPTTTNTDVEVVTTPTTPTPMPSETPDAPAPVMAPAETPVTPVTPDAAAIPPAPAPVAAPAPEPTSSTSPMAISRTEVVSYMSPAGNETIELSVTVSDGVVTAVTATPQATNDVSKKFQGNFTAAISSNVVGKKLTELNLDAVGGSSLTTGAFNKYIQTF